METDSLALDKEEQISHIFLDKLPHRSHGNNRLMTGLQEIGLPGQELVQHTRKWKSPSHPKCLVFSFGVKKGDIL